MFESNTYLNIDEIERSITDGGSRFKGISKDLPSSKLHSSLVQNLNIEAEYNNL